MKNCGIASLFLDKEKFYPILSQNQNINLEQLISKLKKSTFVCDMYPIFWTYVNLN